MVQAAVAGTGTKALAPFAPNTPHAAAGSGWAPPGGSQVSVHVAWCPSPESSTMLRSAGPDGAEGSGLGAADGVGHGTAGTLAAAADADGDPPAPARTVLPVLPVLPDDVAPQPASRASAAS